MTVLELHDGNWLAFLDGALPNVLHYHLQPSFPPTPPGFFSPNTQSRPPFSPTQPPLRSPTPANSQTPPTSSPTLPTSPQTFTPRLTQARPFDLRPDPAWQPNEEFYDQTKVGGLELARTIRPSQFSSSYNIEGCDPLLIPLRSLLYAGVKNHALRRIAAGRETYVVPTSDLPTCFLFTNLNRELKQRNIDIDRAAQTFCRTKGEVLDRSDACKRAAQEIANIIQQWVPIGTPDFRRHCSADHLRSSGSPGRRRLLLALYFPSTTRIGLDSYTLQSH